ncbi:SxtJ family membrane protein [Candidatus Parabeggiatoa sp. HSG14]|uniref:SxtJ family membrane protein n=1 Tax=Candidatus Parabeggiatoa sp. HSG14 TaxID=3055593 RepID=UPI0025A6EB48|nr:SxtJ family membrane protein [Thiotrichales bacterium HSG14]
MHIEIPDKKGLQEFALITGGLFVGLFGLLFPWLFGFAFPLWPWIIAGVLCSLALLIPNSLKWIYQGWMFIAMGLGWINTRLLLAIVFYLMIVPIGLVMRLFGKSPIKDKLPQSESYRNFKKTLLPEQMEHPF